MKTVISGNHLIKLLSLTLILSFAAPFMTTGQTGNVNFTGSWALNAGKSTMGDNPRMGGGDITVVHDGNNLNVERTRTNRDGQTMTTTMKYTLDGKECLNTSPRGENKSVAKWSADGKILTINTSRTFEMNGETINMKSTEVWTLTDPKTITIQSTMSTPDGDRTMTLVYDKK